MTEQMDFEEAKKVYLEQCEAGKYGSELCDAAELVIFDAGEAGFEFISSLGEEDPDFACSKAWLYEHGLGVEQDYAEAFRLYKLSADQGHAVAQNNLAYLSEKGVGVEQDYGEAFRLYKLSADKGDADAQNNLGYMYYNGRGTDKNITMALKYFIEACDQDLEDAFENIEKVLEELKTDEVVLSDNFQEARDQATEFEKLRKLRARADRALSKFLERHAARLKREHDATADHTEDRSYTNDS